MSEAVIVASVRSAGGRYKRGGLADTRADVFGVQVIKGLLERVPQLDPKDIDDVIVGCAFPEAEAGMNFGKVLAVGAGLPERCDHRRRLRVHDAHPHGRRHLPSQSRLGLRHHAQCLHEHGQYGGKRCDESRRFP